MGKDIKYTGIWVTFVFMIVKQIEQMEVGVGGTPPPPTPPPHPATPVPSSLAFYSYLALRYWTCHFTV